MLILLYILMIFICLLSILLLWILQKTKKLLRRNFELNLYLKKLVTTISQIRYGNLKSRVEEGISPLTSELTKILNATIESISDRENMIQEHIAREKEAAILKTDFIATLTHDLKVPVIAQDKTFDLLLENKFGELNDFQKEALTNIKISNMDLKYLIEALLETYKLEQAKLEINVTYGVRIVSCVREIISQLEPIAMAHNKKINYFVNIDEDFLVDIDTFLLKRVFQNLVLNALSHSTSSDKIDVALSANDKNFRLDIRDYGVGIEEDEIKKIFDKYYSGVTKFMRSGVGLGLYLSNKIVKMHKGKIEVESKSGEGAKFSVILPIKYENSP